MLAFSSRSATGLGFLESTRSLSPGCRGHGELVAGEVIALEPGLWQSGIGGVCFEDLLLATGGGSETLMDYPYDPAPGAAAHDRFLEWQHLAGAAPQ